MQITRFVTLVALAMLAAASTHAVTTPAQTKLNNCQNVVKNEGKKFVTAYVAAVGTCLQQVSTDIVKNNLGTPTEASAKACVNQYRRINDTRALGKSLVEKLQGKITAACAPGTFTLQDVLGTVATVPEALDAGNLGIWCTGSLGGDGSIDSLQEWVDCITAAHTCAARSAIVAQYPRALDWLPQVQPVMAGTAPPATDPTRVSDAVAGLLADDTAIEGNSDDGLPEIICGPNVVCGDNFAATSEACDGADLAGHTCSSLGFVGGSLGCTACNFDLSGCSGCAMTQQPPASGQMTAYGAGSDGFVQAGATLSYTDNGDGTISDNSTGLMWEKKSDDGSIHDKHNFYRWGMTSPPDTMNGTMVTTFLNQLNNRCKNDETITCSVDADCSVPGGPCGFAGYRDWRIPNVKELHGIVNYEVFSPSVSSAFDIGCVAGCTVTTCSCTHSFSYWSSTTQPNIPTYAWLVNFLAGGVVSGFKTNLNSVRAVRGGS